MNALLERGVHMLLRAYPPPVRDAFGEEIESLVIATWNEERQARGAFGRTLLLARLLGNTLFSALAFRLDALRHRRSRSFGGLDMRSLAYAATLSRLLYSVTAHDPAVFTLVPALLLLVASIAVWIPARRASAVDPVEALRVD